MSTTTHEDSTNNFLESPSRYKCPRRRCKAQLIDQVCGIGKLSGRTVLMVVTYCPVHGERPVSERRQVVAKKVKDIRLFGKEEQG